MGDARLHVNSDYDGSTLVAADGLPRRSWWRLSLSQVVTIVGSMIAAALVASGAWYSLNAQVQEHERKISTAVSAQESLRSQQVQTDIAVGKMTTKIEDLEKSLNVRLDDIKDAVHRIDDRSAAVPNWAQRYPGTKP
jgi:hypothetical protein